MNGLYSNHFQIEENKEIGKESFIFEVVPSQRTSLNSIYAHLRDDHFSLSASENSLYSLWSVHLWIKVFVFRPVQLFSEKHKLRNNQFWTCVFHHMNIFCKFLRTTTCISYCIFEKRKSNNNIKQFSKSKWTGLLEGKGKQSQLLKLPRI